MNIFWCADVYENVEDEELIEVEDMLIDVSGSTGDGDFQQLTSYRSK